MIHTKKELVTQLQNSQSVLHSYGVRRLGVFGSFAHGTSTASSDVDLLVEFESGRKTYRNFSQLAEYLEGLLERRVELLTRESLSPIIGPRILATVEYVV